MSDIKNKITGGFSKLVAGIIGGLSQDESKHAEYDKSVTEGMPELLRQAAAEGAVLLKNDGTLPLSENVRLSVFGRCQFDWFFTGYGSGGDVVKPYAVNLTDGISACKKIKLNSLLAKQYSKWCEENPVDHGFWGHWPRYYPEMPVDIKLACSASAGGGVAAYVIGRSSGEDRENTLEKGSYYVTDEELSILGNITNAFEKTIVILNIGSIIDLSFLDAFGDKIAAVLIVWQGGMESGNAVADILCGDSEPSGRLTDTIVKSYESYPCASCFGNKDYNCYEEDIYVGYRWFESFDKDGVLYPFGYGLGYTDFSFSDISVSEVSEGISVSLVTTNIGKRSGKQTVQLYVKKPCGKHGNPARCLIAYHKTKLLKPGEKESASLVIPWDRLSHYDQYESAYLLCEGEYTIYLGENVREAKSVYVHKQENSVVLEQLSEQSAPAESFEVFCAVESVDGRLPVKRPVKTRSVSLRSQILEKLPKTIHPTGYRGYSLSDVKCGKTTMERFVAQLSNDELEALTRGDYIMNSPLGAKGNAAVFGGVTQSLRDMGVPAVTCTDGPSGIRLQSCCSLIPIGTLLACSFDEKLVERVYAKLSEEMKSKGSDVLLAPGMNIHRSPLCGRNFEYYSEDPLVSGLTAAAAVKGIQSAGVSACPKHFACNSQEYNRNKNDSRLSERALREIYLKGFEICVKTAKPKNLMTSYNKINGVWGHYNYELCTAILRDEWGYEGNVMTDWWMQYAPSPEFPAVRDNAYRVRAQVDLLMPGGKRVGKKKPDGTLLESLNTADGITLGEIQRSAINVLSFCLDKVE